MSSPQLIPYTEGREGYVVYKDDKGLLKFYFEFGGGDCVAIVNIPREEEWAGIEGRTPAEREPVLKWIAEELLQTQMKKGSYKIKAGCIEFYSR